MENSSILLVKIAAWAASWLVFSFVLSPLVLRSLPKIGEKYKSLSREKCWDWNIRMGSIVSAFLATLLAANNILTHLSENVIYQTSSEGSFPLEFMMGFFVADLIVIFKNREYYGRKSVIEYTGHHIVSLIGFYLALNYQALLWYANYRLLSEFSTPLINGRFFLQEMGMRDSPIYAVNRICTMCAFCLCRIFTIPKFWISTYANYDEIMKCEGCLIAVLFISGILLDTLNITWFCTIMKIVIAELSKIPEMAKELPKMAKEKSNIIRAKLTVKRKEMVKSFNEAKGEMKNQLNLKMDHLKDGMMNKMDTVRRRLNNSLRRE